MSNIFTGCLDLYLPSTSHWITENVLKTNKMTIKYIINNNDSTIKLFGELFVKNNKDKCLLMLDEELLELSVEYNLTKNKNKKELNFILLEEKRINDMSYMFYECESMFSLPDILSWDINNITNIDNMFIGCKSLSNLIDITKWINLIFDKNKKFFCERNYCL